MNRVKWTCPLIILFIGFPVPFGTWTWAKGIGGGLVFFFFPDPVMIVFNAISFSILAVIAYLLYRNYPELDRATQTIRVFMLSGGLLALLAFSLFIQMSYWLSRSSTASLIYIFYIPYVVILLTLGLFLGWATGRLHALLSGKGLAPVSYAISGTLLLFYLCFNLHINNYGKFTLPPEIGIKTVPEMSAGTRPISKTLFFQTKERLGAITSIDLKSCIPDKEARLTITGRGGAAFVKIDGTMKSFLRFERVGGFNIYPVDVEEDGVCEFVDDAGGWQPVGLIDSDGKRLWAYGKPMGTRDTDIINVGYSPQDIVAFDAQGDGRLEFLIPLLIVGKQETHMVTAGGRLLQKLPYDLQGAKVADINGDGIDELITIERSRLIPHYIVRNADFNIIHKYSLSYTRDHVAVRLIRWPDARGEWHGIYSTGKSLRVLKLSNGSIYDITASQDLNYFNTSFVKFAAEEQPYIVTTDSYKGTNTISIYNPEKKLIHKETLAGGGNIFIHPDSMGKTETVLVTECSKKHCGVVWQYALR